jgi:hypothetical protein
MLSAPAPGDRDCPDLALSVEAALRQGAQAGQSAWAVRAGYLDHAAVQCGASDVRGCQARGRDLGDIHRDPAFLELGEQATEFPEKLAASGNGPVLRLASIPSFGKFAHRVDDRFVERSGRQQHESLLGVDAQRHQQGGNSSQADEVGR